MRKRTVFLCVVLAGILLVPTSFAVMAPKDSSVDTPASIMKGGGGGRSPDLIIADVWTSPSSPVAGEPTTIYAQVQNIGTKDIVSTPFYNMLYIGESMYEQLDLTDLAAGAYVVWSTTRGLLEGTHELRGVADSGNDIAESIETNNEMTEYVYWSNPSPDIYDFEDGPSSISDWTTVVSGNGVLEVVADPGSESLYSLHISGGGLSTTRATSPAIAEWESLLDYTVTMKYYITLSKWAVVYDDTRVVIESRLGTDLEAHLYALIDVDPYVIDLGAVNHNEWMTIEIVVSVYAPSLYWVYVNGELRSEYGIPLITGVNPEYNTFTVGSRDPAGSKDLWNVYWDDIRIEQ